MQDVMLLEFGHQKLITCPMPFVGADIMVAGPYNKWVTFHVTRIFFKENNPIVFANGLVGDIKEANSLLDCGWAIRTTRKD